MTANTYSAYTRLCIRVFVGVSLIRQSHIQPCMYATNYLYNLHQKKTICINTHAFICALPQKVTQITEKHRLLNF